MKTEVMFSRKSDEWSTPQVFFDELNAEFQFTCDVAATNENTKCDEYFSAETDALTENWADGIESFPVLWMNPPYSKCKQFIAKAYYEAKRGATVVALVPARTDTKWWHEYVWDDVRHRPRPRVEVRFVRGRLKFGGSENSAPFPSAVIIFRPGEIA